MKEDFLIKIETWHKPDLGALENVSSTSQDPRGLPGLRMVLRLYPCQGLFTVVPFFLRAQEARSLCLDLSCQCGIALSLI